MYVYSTVSTDVAFEEYHPAPENSIPQVKRRVVIRGGANCATKQLITPRGVATQISDDDYLWLTTHPQVLDSFQRFVNDGFMQVDNRKEDPDAVASGMEAADGSAPKTPADFKALPTVGAPG